MLIFVNEFWGEKLQDILKKKKKKKKKKSFLNQRY